MSAIESILELAKQNPKYTIFGIVFIFILACFSFFRKKMSDDSVSFWTKIILPLLLLFAIISLFLPEKCSNESPQVKKEDTKKDTILVIPLKDTKPKIDKEKKLLVKENTKTPELIIDTIRLDYNSDTELQNGKLFVNDKPIILANSYPEWSDFYIEKQVAPVSISFISKAGKGKTYKTTKSLNNKLRIPITKNNVQ